MPDFPDVPTLKELGVDVTYTAFYGLGAIKGTPPEVTKALEDAFNKAFKSPELQADFQRIGLEAQYLDAKEFKRFLDTELEKVRVVMGLLDKRK